jgi:hypothetical protein
VKIMNGRTAGRNVRRGNGRPAGRGAMKGVDLERKDHWTGRYEGCRFGTEGPLDGRYEE